MGPRCDGLRCLRLQYTSYNRCSRRSGAWKASTLIESHARACGAVALVHDPERETDGTVRCDYGCWSYRPHFEAGGGEWKPWLDHNNEKGASDYAGYQSTYKAVYYREKYLSVSWAEVAHLAATGPFLNILHCGVNCLRTSCHSKQPERSLP